MVNEKASPVIKILNFVLMFAIVWLAFVLSTGIVIDREPLNPLASYFMHWPWLISPILFVGYMIFKEFKTKTLMKRVYINLIILACVFAQTALLQSLCFGLI